MTLPTLAISTAYLNAAKAVSFHDAAVENLVNLADSLACDPEDLVLSVVVGALVRFGYQYVPPHDRFVERTALP